MRLELSSIRPVVTTAPPVPSWDHLTGIIGPPPSTVPGNAHLPGETVLSMETLRSTLIEIGAAVTKGNLALADAMAKLGVPLTEANMLEGQTLLARLPGVSPAVFALTKALDLAPTPAIMRALSAVVDQNATTSHLDLHTLDILSLLPQPGTDAEPLSSYLTALIEKLGQSTENKLFVDPDSANLLSIYDSRSSLLDLAATQRGGTIAAAADHHASFIEGQQLLNQVSVQKFDNPAPLYFAFPIALASREAACEIQVWSGNETEIKDALSQDREEYLRATVRVKADRLGIIDVSLVGMWSGRLICTLYTAKAATQRILKRETPALALALGSLGWRVTPIEVVRQHHFAPLWLGGDMLDAPRSRVDQRI